MSINDRDIRIVFLDIDGTIYFNGKLVPSAKYAVQILKEKNIQVVLCTGRSIVHAKWIQDALNISNGVYFNGSLAIHNNGVIYSTPFQKKTILEVIEYCEFTNHPLLLHTAEDAISFEEIPKKYHSILKAYDFPTIRNIDRNDIKQDELHIYQMNIFLDKSWDKKLQTEFPDCLVYRWDHQAVDLQRGKNDKSIGAKAILDKLQISPEYALHIGDGGNDIGMFQFVNYSIAMGNASKEVKEHAKWITTRADEDGVYLGLQKMGLIPDDKENLQTSSHEQV